MDQGKRNALTITEAAHEYGLPVYCLRTLVKEHKLPVIQSGSRCYILRSVMESYLQTGGEPYKVS